MLNLGNINFGLGVDTAPLQRATSRVVAFGRQVEAAANATGQGARQIEAAMRRQEAAALKALQQTLRMNDAIRKGTAGGQQAGLLRATTTAFSQLSDQMTRGQRSAIAYQRAMESFEARMGSVQRQLRQVTSNANLSTLGNFMKDLSSATVLAIGPLSGFGARIGAIAAISTRSSFALAALVTGVVAVGTAFAGLSSQTVRTAIDLERIRSRLENATGSVDLAEEQFKDLQRIANTTGNEFVALATQFSRFQAAAVGTNLEGDKAREIFENLATAIGNFQLDAASAEGVFRAVEQMMSKGNVTAEELRQQLGDRLPGAFKAAADALGVTTAKLNAMLKKGKVTAEEFLIPFSREVRKRLGGDAVDGITGLTSSLNRLQNAWTNFLDKFNEAFQISKTFEMGVKALTSALDFLADNVKATALAIGALSGAFLLLALPRIVAGLTAAAGAMRVATLAATGLGAALTLGTIGSWIGVFSRVAVIAGAAALSMGVLGSNTAEAATAEKEMAAAAEQFIRVHEKQNTSVEENAKVFVDATGKKIEAIFIQIAALQKLDMAQADFIKNFDNSGLKWFERGADEWFARFVAGRKQAYSETQGAIKPLMGELDKLKERFDKLQAIKERNSKTPLGLGDTEGLDRAGRALRDANQEIEKLLLQNEKMMEGPVAFEKFERAAEIANKVQQFRDRLMDAGLAMDVVNQKVEQFRFALENNVNIADNYFKNMQAAFEAFKGIGVNAFNSVADALGKAVADGELNAETFVNIVKDMVAQIISQILKMAIINPLLNSMFGGMGGPGALPTFPGMGFAKGGAFNGGVQFMAKGGILGGPTMFGTRNGLAVGGEAGDEAVMPLIRSSSGHLGVRAVGGGGGRQGNNVINIITPPGAKAEQRERSSGGDQIQDIVISIVDKAIAGGQMDRSLGARFGGRNRLAGVS
jgi:tape measure domain-containing protein